MKPARQGTRLLSAHSQWASAVERFVREGREEGPGQGKERAREEEGKIGGVMVERVRGPWERGDVCNFL